MRGSALYAGTVWHRRLEPVEHRFAYPVRMVLLDMAELPGALDAHPLWSARRPAPVRFRPRDHMHGREGEGPKTPHELARRARELVRDRSGISLDGPVRVLSTPRTLGIGFNPVTFTFVHPDPESPPAAAIAEVTSTPWGERHRYVVSGQGEDGGLVADLPKRLHVSPYNPMEQDYELRVGAPGEHLRVSIACRQDGRTVFRAGLALERRELSRREMTGAMTRHPAAVAVNLARIYSHGLRLRLKGAPHHRHPGRGAGGSEGMAGSEGAAARTG